MGRFRSKSRKGQADGAEEGSAPRIVSSSEEVVGNPSPAKEERKRKKRPADLKEEVSRLDREVEALKSSVKSLLSIYEAIDGLPVSDGEVASSFPLLFQAVRRMENQMDSIAAKYMADDQPSVQEHERLDRLYSDFVAVLQGLSPEAAGSGVTLESLQNDEGVAPGPRFSPEEGDGYHQDDEEEMLTALRMSQQCMEGLLVKTARGGRASERDIDMLDHWYQVFASFR